MKKHIASQLDFLASVFVAPLFSSCPFNKTIRWLFILDAFLAFMSAFGFAANIPNPTSPIAWNLIFLALSILLSVYFRNFVRQVT